MNKIGEMSRSDRLELVDARDNAKNALEEYRGVDEPNERLADDLYHWMSKLEMELSAHSDQQIIDDVTAIFDREDRPPRQHAARIQELLQMFDDLGFGRLVEA